MNKKLGWICAVFLFIVPIQAQVIFQQPLSPRNANYRMEVTLDVEKKQIQGRETLTWRNITNDAVGELQFHLYMNAFKNNRSTHIAEQGGNAGILEKKKAWGWIDVNRLQIVDGEDLTQKIEFIHPDDDNEDDCTVMRVPLPNPVRPGQEIRIDIDFVTQLPYVFRRNGYYKDFFFAVQWFPKVGVFINGSWNCHQYHANSEFFADYGVYEVDITLPKEYIVGATGLLQKTTETDATKTLTFRAEDVHDFGWTAWPHYQIKKETYKGVEITLLYDEDHASSVPRYFGAMRNDFDFFPEWGIEYPYPNVTVIDPPTGCMGVAGMEYPTFFTGGAFWWMPKGILATEMVTVHEFGHNIWYGIVGNNEFEEAWLDEGINSYMETRIMDKYYGEQTSMINILGIRMGELAYQRSGYIPIVRRDRILRNSWTYIGGGYGTFSYQKPALMLWTLENLVGRETMDRIMQTFFHRWKFKHPSSQDFIDVVNDVTGQNYDWYFDQVLKGSGDVDYAVMSVRTGKVKERKGVFERDGQKVTLPEPGEKKEKESAETKSPDVFESIVRVHRKGEVIIPVDILITFENGETVQQTWDGKDRWVKYEFEKPTKLVSAVVDPDRKIVLDSNFSNNSRTVKPQKKAVTYLCTRFLHWFESALHLISFFG
ncbi:MAG: M1 family metallopeptidase [bacterium]